MATNMYLKFEEPAVPSSGQKIEILSWSHGFSPSSQGRGEASAPNTLSLTKYLDDTSTELIKLAWSGKQFAKATLTCYRSDGARDNEPVLYLAVKMERVVIANFSVSGGPGDIPVETLTLDYGIIQYEYTDRRHEQPLMKSVTLDSSGG